MWSLPSSLSFHVFLFTSLCLFTLSVHVFSLHSLQCSEFIELNATVFVCSRSIDLFHYCHKQSAQSPAVLRCRQVFYCNTFSGSILRVARVLMSSSASQLGAISICDCDPFDVLCVWEQRIECLLLIDALEMHLSSHQLPKALSFRL